MREIIREECRAHASVQNWYAYKLECERLLSPFRTGDTRFRDTLQRFYRIVDAVWYSVKGERGT